MGCSSKTWLHFPWIRALLPRLRLLRLETQTPLPRDGRGHHGIPAAPRPPSARGFSGFSAAFTFCFPHPQPISCASLPAAAPGRRDVRAVGLNAAGKPARERGCPPASVAAGGILGAVVPARAAVIQRLSEAHGTGVALHRPARFHGLLLLPCLTFCSLDSSVISLGSIFSCWVDSPGCVPYLCRIGHLHQSLPNPLWTPPKPAAEGSDSLKYLPNTSTSTCSIGAVHWCCFGMWDPGGINGLWRWLHAPGWNWDGSGSIFHPGFVVRPRQKGSVLHSLPVPLLRCQTLSGAPGCAGSPQLVQMWQRWGFS